MRNFSLVFMEISNRNIQSTFVVGGVMTIHAMTIHALTIHARQFTPWAIHAMAIHATTIHAMGNIFCNKPGIFLNPLF